jgi:DNA topoisomerase-2
MTNKVNTAKIIAEQVDEHKVFETPEQQILARTGMWAGSSRSSLKQLAIYEEGGFVTKEVEIIPAVAKIIEELIINSADEHVRTKDVKLRGWTLDKIKIDLSETGHLSVWDNGGITSQLHSTGMYPIEVVFGKLFSSSNYDDTVERHVTGTNGVGSVLTNIFSKKFSVKSSDTVNQIEVTWSDNKSSKSEAIVTKSKEHFTLIEAHLDIERFDIETIPLGIMKYIERLSIILAASNPGLEVEFNGDSYKFDSFLDYAKLYGFTDIFGEKNDSWEVYLAPTYGAEPVRYAIVNSAECNDGTHIKHLDMLVRWHIGQALKKAKIDNVTAQMIQSSYHAIVNITVDKPEYSSQSKTELTNEIFKIDKDGKKTNLTRTAKFVEQLENGPIAKYVIEQAKEKDAFLNSKELAKKAKELSKKSAKTIRKLIDAGESSKAKRKDCELWIFEGASAGSGFRANSKPMIQGCYLLKGKCKNSLCMSTLAVMGNQEFADITVALGLDPRKPHDLSGLRYGKVVISTDMDYDGHSIFGQILTFFAIHYPAMLEAGMIYRAMSPIYKATKAKQTLYFYSYEEFDKWSASKDSKGYEITYFKGLGSLEKSDYATMLKDSRLQQMQLDEAGLQLIHAFMGPDSAPRKRLLEANV